MKRVRIFLLGLAVALVIIFWTQLRPAKEQLRFANVGAAISIDRRVLPLVDGTPVPQPTREPELAQRDSMVDTLALIRGKLVQLSEVAKADKGTEDDITTDLLAILTDDNAAEITRALTIEERHSRFGLAALQRWLKVDVWTAGKWVAAQTEPSDEQAWAVAHALVGDRAALERYCSQLADNRWRQLFLKQATLAATRQDPVEAIHLAHQMNEKSAELDLLETTISSWMTDHPDAASKWIRNVRHPLVREEFVCVGAKTLGASDPLGAIEWLLSSLSGPAESSQFLLEETIQEIVGNWAQTAPAQAARMAAQFPRGNLRDATVQIVSRHWLQRDPVAAADWIKALPEPERVRAIYPSN